MDYEDFVQLYRKFVGGRKSSIVLVEEFVKMTDALVNQLYDNFDKIETVQI